MKSVNFFDQVSMNMLGMLTVIRYSSWTAAIFVDPDIVWAVLSGPIMSTEACQRTSRRSAMAISSSDEDIVIENVMDGVME